MLGKCHVEAYPDTAPIIASMMIMFYDQHMALENLRFFARGGHTPEFYDLLRWHVLDLAKLWPTLPLSDEENLVLAGSKGRLLCELAYLRSLAVLKNGPGLSNRTPSSLARGRQMAGPQDDQPLAAPSL